MTATEKKLSRLNRILSEPGSCIIACSGGTDSIFLLHQAFKAKGADVLAVTIKTPYMPSEEIAGAEDFCNKNGIRHRIIELTFPEVIRENPEDRCYLCKKTILKTILEIAVKEGYDFIFDGSNADDAREYRPGMRALKESGVRSPLLEANMTKKEIRIISKSAGLDTWDKPANACMLTRFPHGTHITAEELLKVEKAETFLTAQGFRGARVRVHGDLARIEFRSEQLTKALMKANREKIAEKIKSIGYRYVSVDLDGYVTGKMNNKPVKDECCRSGKASE
jgi:pyridinium-3,5-biscarboxylic acid mononucleotide sulfurtransferase